MWKRVVPLAVLFALTFAARLAAADEPAPEPKNRGTAFALAGGGTALSIGVTAVGLAAGNGPLIAAGALSSLVTPSAGAWYAGESLTWGLGIRLLSSAVLIAGAAEGFKCVGHIGYGSGNGEPCEHDPRRAGNLVLIGGIGYGVGVLYDILTAGSAVDRYNERFHVRVAPIASSTAASGRTFGLGVHGSF